MYCDFLWRASRICLKKYIKPSGTWRITFFKKLWTFCVVSCSSPTSPCRYGAVAFLLLHGPASLLLWLKLSWAWVLGSQGTLCIIELQHVVQENSLVYSMVQCYMGSTWNWNLCATLGNSQDRSLRLYGTIPGTAVLYVLLRPLPVPKCHFGAGKKKLPLWKLVLLPPHFQIIPKGSDSSLCSIWHLRHSRPNISFCDDLLPISPCLFPTFIDRMFSGDSRNGLYGSFPSRIPFQGSMFRLTSARLLGDSISTQRTKQNRISY
jgi:hypothetical protein